MVNLNYKYQIILLTLLFFTLTTVNAIGVDPVKYVTGEATHGSFPLATNNKVPIILVSNDDHAGVLRALDYLRNDLFMVTGHRPELINDINRTESLLVIVGTLGKSPFIDQLVREGKIDGSQLAGKWEKYTTQIVENPFEGIKKALVIAGSDKRGTIYGMFDLSEQIGVSPWYYWADVPIEKHSELHVLPGIHTLGEPKVKYRGIFLNDEWPALGGWATQKFGGLNHKFYEKVFELILRLKGNYLWPAMWGSEFYADDPLNGELANEYGIVMGTSHHEPLARAHREWKSFGGGAWNYKTNPEQLEAFWTGGMERAKNWESIITIGMRGDGDEPMTEGTAIDLLESIVKEQRKIITDVTGKPADKTPQMWALYKEVQDYYDKGMKVPDDVTLLLCDDNWGNIRRLPKLDAADRQGGYGMYYHFDYVGGPRNYKWINTNQIERTWEQMHIAYKHGVDRIWIVNVGDLKPMELPISFFLDYAWDPDKWNADNLPEYYTIWVNQQFDGQFTLEIADLLKKYTKYNRRRTPELLDENTFSLSNYKEWQRVAGAYADLERKSDLVETKLNPKYKNAYFELVGFPIKATNNLYQMYYYTALNHQLAKENNGLANQYADSVAYHFKKDSILTRKYHMLENGKWDQMMSQKHIGYKIWQEPKMQEMPKVERVEGAVKPIDLTKETAPTISKPKGAKGFIEQDGYIAMEAEHFAKKYNTKGCTWKIVENLGKTGDAVISLPVNGRIPLTESSPKLSYNVYFKTAGKVKVKLYFSPTLNYTKQEGMYFGLSIDNNRSILVNYDSDPYIFNYNGSVPSQWEKNVGESIKIITVELDVDKPGNHVLNYYQVDEGLVLQRIIIETSASHLKETYLGPPESHKAK